MKDDSGAPLANVSVQVLNSNAGTKTDENGYFELTLPADASSLTFSLMGYGNKQEEIGTRSSFQVSLSSSINDLDEVVVVGYTQKK